MNATVVDMKDLLVSQALGTFKADLFIAQFPMEIDDCILLVDGAGRSPELNYEWEQPAFRIMVRNTDYVTGDTKIRAVAALLHGYQGTVGGANYKLIEQEGDISWIGQDEKNRHIFSTRYQVQRTTA